MSVRSVLVTGAAGFVGQKVSAALAAAGWQVTGLDRVAPPEGGAASPFAAFWPADLLREETPAPPESGFTAVVHLAGILPARGGRGELFAVNVAGTSAVLERYAAPGCHLLLFSSGLVYGNQPGPFVESMPCLPAEPYGQSKLCAEALVAAWSRATRSPACLLRPSVIYGTGAPPGMLLVSLMKALRAREPFPMTAGEQRRDFLHIDDAAAAVVCLLERRTAGTFNLAAGESHTVREAAELGADIAGRRDLLQVGALPYRPHEIFDYRLAGGALRAAASWQPRVTLEEGLRRLWQELA